MSDRIVFLDLPKTRIFLSPVERDDLPFFRRALNNPNIARFLADHDPLLDIQEEDWYNNLPKRKMTEKHCSIILKETNEVIGEIGMHRIDWVSRTATTGTFLGREDLLGKGFGTEAKMLWLKFAFLELNLRQIYSRVYSFNGRSAAYARKCGYREIARYPEYIFREGEYHDLIHFVVTREEDWLPLWREFEKKMKGESE